MSDGLEFDVVVIGAGVAGLAAARMIAEAGLRVVVLEAQERVGGRIWTLREGNEVIELGAEFVHGRAPELWDLIEEAGLETYERTGAFMRAGDGGPVALEHEEDEVLEGLEGFVGPDCSFADYVERAGLSAEDAAWETAYVEGFNAADAREVSVRALGVQQRAQDAIDGERSWRVTEGYDRVPEFLRERVVAAGGEVLMRACVLEVDWGGYGGRGEEPRRRVMVRCGDGRVFAGDRVVVTVSLGVLQAGVVRFVPEPAGVMAAAGRMRMGHVVRVTMVFRRRIWPEEMSFLLVREWVPGVWWSGRGEAGAAESLALTGWVGGPRSSQFKGLDAGELGARVTAALAAALGLDSEAVRREVVAFYTHEWDEDEWSRGAYSWVPVSGLEASAEMSEPVEETLFFAGEHTDTTGHWGTVHAALRSGLRAGWQVVAAAGRGGETDSSRRSE